MERMRLAILEASWDSILRCCGVEFRKRSTGVLVALCTFHKERTASMLFWPRSGQFRCFGCSEGGTKFDFVCRRLFGRKLSFDDYPFRAIYCEDHIEREKEEYRRVLGPFLAMLSSGETFENPRQFRLFAEGE